MSEQAARPSRRHAIRGALVYLRPTEPEDADLVGEWYEDAELARLMGELPESRAARRARYQRQLTEHDRSTADFFSFVICLLDDDRPVGRTDLFEIDRVNGSAVFGIGIGERALWGAGHGSDAVNALVDFAFGELRLERVWLGTDAGNERAQRAYAKCGFTIEARLRHSYVERGRFIDEIRMALLREEWLALPRKRSWEYDAPA
jgi:RimJ/RimL family protein N-acetyltransferase